MDSEFLNQAVQILGTIGGLSLVVALVVQSLVKPALFARYGGEEAAKQNTAYPFTVNVLAFVTAAVFASVGIFALDGLPVDGNGWATAGGNILVGAVMASLASAGIESAAGNIKKLLLK